MRLAAAGVAAALALVVPAVAKATTTRDATLARKGLAHAVQRHWVKAPDAQRYRNDVTRALLDVKRLPKLRAQVVASQLSQLTPLWDSYTSPRGAWTCFHSVGPSNTEAYRLRYISGVRFARMVSAISLFEGQMSLR